MLFTAPPQRSILGHLLFVLLINDLPTRLKICGSLMYADDTVLFHSSRDVHAIEKALSSDLEVVENCLGDNSLFLNKTKTECVLFGTATRLSSETNFSIYVSGDLIKRV